MKPDDDDKSWAFMMFLGREGSRIESATGMALTYVSIVLMFIGVSLAFCGSRIYGGVIDEALATLFTLVLIGTFISFVIAETEPTRKLAAGVMVGFWLGLIDGSRLWWGITGVAIQAVAFALAIIAERKTSLREDDDIGFRAYRWSWERAQQRVDNVWKVFLRRITGKRSPADPDDSVGPDA